MKDNTILVLGHKGMLGNVVYSYLNKSYEVYTISHRFPNKKFINYLENFNGLIVNCIGAIPQKTNDFSVNVELSNFLSTLPNKIIHPNTDCEDDDTEYGKSKKKSSSILLKNENVRVIKTSILGKELNSCYSLLDWFLSSNGNIFGYTKAMWNGITTLEWAKRCDDIILNWNKYGKITIFNSDCISKYELLTIISNVFGKEIKITPIDKGEDKCLSDGIYTKSIKTQLLELKEYYE